MRAKAKVSTLYCSVCGRSVGTRPGTVVVLDLVCDDSICNAQPAPSVNQHRDALVTASVLAGVPVSTVAGSFGVSRQRIYQILDAWKGAA